MEHIDFSQIRYVYGLDNGNGNLMAYRLDMRIPPEKRVKEPIVDKEGEPAGFAMTADGKMQLGRQLEGTDFSSFAACEIFPVNFKAIPTIENRAVMVQYLKAWLERMKKNCPSIEADGKNAVWLIGCPNGWKKKKFLDAYRDIFIEAGYAHPVIVSESNAAMMHFVTSNRDMEAESLQGGVMCVDVGAYSNDGTFVLPGKVVSEGSFAGAGIIDKMIVSANLYAEHMYRQAKKPYNDPKLTEAVCRRFETEPVFRSFLLLQGRWLKEQYFTRKNNNTLPTAGKDLTAQIYLDDYPAFDGADIFTLFINTRMAEELTVQIPIRYALGDFSFSQLSKETREEIGNHTWKQCFENFLYRLADAFPEFKERAMAESGPKAVVMLTGGASQMDFVPVTIEEVFPNVRVCVDPTPTLSIAMGLMDFAPDKLRAMAFDQAFLDILEEKMVVENGKEIYCVEEYWSEAYLKFCGDSIQYIAFYENEDMVAAVNDWADYKYNSSMIGQKAGERFSEHFDKKILPGMVEDSKKANAFLVDTINARFQDLLMETGFENPNLFADGELHLDFTGYVIEKKMPVVKQHVLDIYANMQKNKFSQFPNLGRFDLFQQKRNAFLTGIAQEMNEILDKIAVDLLEYLKAVFCNRDLSDDFAQESFLRIYAELKQKKRTLLGDLIVEESYEDKEEE